MEALIVLVAIVSAYIYFDPYVDIDDDSIFIWYNWKGHRSYYVLWSRDKV